MWGYERALIRAGLAPVAGADEAGRGACAGPLVVAAVVLPDGKRGQVPGLADSKLLTPQAREAVYAQILRRAEAWTAVVIPPSDVDHAVSTCAMSPACDRQFCGCTVRPSYVLTDGFPVPGLPVPSLAVWKGDRIAACVAAASVVAKVTRDRLMVTMHDDFPVYEFAAHKGYVTPEHQDALLPSRSLLGASLLLHQRRTCGGGAAWACRGHGRSMTTSRCGKRLERRPQPVPWRTCRATARNRTGNASMSAEDLEKYETEMELQLYREYRDVVGLFTYVVETERRFYLTNNVDLQVRSAEGEVYFEVTMSDAWVWDMYRPARFVKNVKVVTFKDVNVEELAKSDLEVPDDKGEFGTP